MKLANNALFRIIAPLAAGAAFAAPVAAHAESISANRPESIVAALQAAGHQAVLGHDDSGDPLIQATIGGWSTQVVFYDCNEITHQSCQSLQFATGFMPERPFGAAQAAAFVRDNRFGAVSIGDDKSVSVTWDVITGSGIDPQVFGLVLKSYRLALDTIGSQVFAPGHQPRLASASR